MTSYWTYGGVEFVHARYAEAFAPHFHDEYSVSVVTAGAMGFSWSRAAHVAEAGAIAAINPGELHTGEPAAQTGWESRNIMVSSALVETIAPALANRTLYLMAPVIRDDRTARLLVAAHKATASGAPSLAKDVSLARALGHLFSSHVGERAKPTPRASTVLARDYLRANFAKTVRLQTLADLIGITHFHLIRSFARDTGFTPHAYQGQLRVAHALDQLKRGRSLAQAAASAGFADQSHMNRAIKRSQGLTPGMIAKAW